MRIEVIDDEDAVGVEVRQQLGLGADDTVEIGEELGVHRRDAGVDQDLRCDQRADGVELSRPAHAGLGDEDLDLFRLGEHLRRQTEGRVSVPGRGTHRKAGIEQGDQHVLGGGLTHRAGDGRDPPGAALALGAGQPPVGIEGILDPNQGAIRGNRIEFRVVADEGGRSHVQCVGHKGVAVGSAAAKRHEEITRPDAPGVDIGAGEPRALRADDGTGNQPSGFGGGQPHGTLPASSRITI